MVVIDAKSHRLRSEKKERNGGVLMQTCHPRQKKAENTFRNMRIQLATISHPYTKVRNNILGAREENPGTHVDEENSPPCH